MPIWFHLTDNPKFELDPSYVPTNLSDTGDEYGTGPLGAGIFLTMKPHVWAFDQHVGDGGAWSGDRPYIVEIAAPAGVHRLPGAWFNADADVPGIDSPGEEETFVPASQFHQLRVLAVRPRRR
jgi:hypothetical protein